MKLSLSPHGTRLAVSDELGTRILDLASGTSARAEIARAVDLALFEDELWVARDGVLDRFSLALDHLASAALPPGERFERCSFGGNFALWLARDAAHAIAGGSIAPVAVDVRADDRVLALSAQRVLRARGGELAILDVGGAVRWRHALERGGRALAIGALFEGRSVAAVVTRDRTEAQQLVVLDQRDGSLQHRISLQSVVDARFTALRGLAVLRIGMHELIVLDVRFGKILRHHREARAIDRLHLDDAGQRVVLGIGDDVVDMALADLIAGRVASVVVGTEIEAELAIAVTPSPPPPAERAIVDTPPTTKASAPLVIGELRALRPPPAEDRASASQVASQLEAWRRLVAARAGLAIARAWDAGTISFVDETRPPFERELAGVVLGLRGLAVDQLSGAERAFVAACAHRADLERALADIATPLDRIAAEFELSPLARELLMLIAAPTLWGELARVYGILANDPHRALCDELLLHDLHGGDRRAIARELASDRPLVRHGLVHVGIDRARPFASLACDPIVLARLSDAPVEGELEHATRSLEELRVPRAELARVLAALDGSPVDPIRLAIRGRDGSGRRTLAAALAAAAGRVLGVVDAARFLREQRLDRLGQDIRRVALRGAIPLVHGLEAIGSDDAVTRDAVRDVLSDHPGPLFLRVAHDARPPLVPGYVEIDLPQLASHERADHWRAALARAKLVVDDPEALAERFSIGPGVIERVVASVTPSGDVAHALERAVRQHLVTRLPDLASPVTRLANWSQVVLPPDIHDSILELIARIRHRHRVFEQWGFDGVTSARGVTALFQGSPGTGKTLVAGAIASELGLDIYRVDLSRVISKWIGETEQNLAKVFAAAEEGQAILLFDEADSLFAKRTDVKSSNDRYANLEVNYLLQRFDTFEGIAFLTTNFGTSIDPAFKRRLSATVTFPFPDEDTRTLLWKAHLPDKLPRSGELDLPALARRYQMSGGYIKNAAIRAAFLAAEERSGLTQAHLERAISTEFREFGKLGETGELR